MCGIVGKIATQGVSPEQLNSMCALLQHRGPDHQGTWLSQTSQVGLGHRRLSIIDLTASANQPMTDASGSLSIVFNGEIYNFRELRAELAQKGYPFKSSSDTEVILAAYQKWGRSCVERLDGMFAFGIYDSTTHTILLARDRAGEKPLFYYHGDGSLIFASELKALLADKCVPRTIDRSSMDCYLGMGFVPGPNSMISGVSKLPPAHTLTFCLENRSIDVKRYWSPPSYSGSAGSTTPEQLVDELEELLEASVKAQLVSDVPLGVLLSGGVDSSLITAMAARNVSNLKTFTVRFPGYGVYDETSHARLIARHFGTDHLELEADRADTSLLSSLAQQYDEPIADSSMIPTYLVSQMVRKHCTVALGGDGGDELFGGYPHYNRLLWLKQRLGSIPLIFRKPIGSVSTRMLPIGFHGRNWLQAVSCDLDKSLPLISSFFDPASRKRLMNNFGAWTTTAEEVRESRIPSEQDLLQRATRMDFDNYLAEDILVKVDRASMLASLELRAPFLDRQLMDFAFAKVPSAQKATSVRRKILLKSLAARVLPSAFDLQRKQGFSIPLAQWVQVEPWRSFFHDVLLSPHCYFDKKTVLSLFSGLSKGRANAERLFQLTLFELWRKHYDVVI